MNGKGPRSEREKDVQRVPKAKNPAKVPPEVQAQSGVARHENGFRLPYP